MVGRPTDYNDEIANEILETISSTPKSVRQLCREKENWPERVTIYRWTLKHKEFGSQYAQAKARQVDWFVEEALDIAYDGSLDTYIDEKGNARCDNEWVQRSRLKVDTLKWYASKLAPRVYGEKIQIEKKILSEDPEIKKAQELASQLQSDDHGRSDEAKG